MEGSSSQGHSLIGLRTGARFKPVQTMQRRVVRMTTSCRLADSELPDPRAINDADATFSARIFTGDSKPVLLGVFTAFVFSPLRVLVGSPLLGCSESRLMK